MALTIDVLGPLGVSNGANRAAVDRPSHLRLLSVLALSAGRRVSTEVLIDRFWPKDPPATAKAAVQTHIAALRRALGDGAIATEGYGYRLVIENGSLDSHVFDALAQKAKQATTIGDWEATLEAVGTAIGLWRGDPYPSLVDDDFARPEITRLTELHLDLLERRAEALISLSREAESLPDLEALVMEHPLRERMWEHLMTARYRLGRNADALRAFQEVSAHLAEIGVEPGERLRRLEDKILLHDQSLTRTRHNLPATLDEFIGRQKELAEISGLLARNRHVSLVGAGGSGKSRLAIEAAQTVLDRFPDGAYFVPLADIDDPSLIATAIAQGIGLATQADDVAGTLEKALRDSSTLLVIDNCEHLVDETAATTGRLLRVAPRLRVLSTSREPLRLQGEVVYTVPGMTVPKAGEDASSADGVRLFNARALQTHPDFDASADPELVAQVCRRLDGMPLAIELAARRAGIISLEDLDARLRESSAVLASGDRTGPPRHQTLEATIDWSYRLLTPEEQEALAKLAVFRGGFDLEMADWILERDSAPFVASLVDRSLIRAYTGDLGQRRYRLLETIRQFALSQAAEQGLAEEAFRAHDRWCVVFADHIWESWEKPGMGRLRIAINEEFENLSSAFERAEAAGNPKLEGRFAEGLLWYWQTLGYLSKALVLYDIALETCENDDRRVGLLAKRALARFSANDIDLASTDAENAYRLSGSLSPSVAKAYAVSTFSHIFHVRPDLDTREGIQYAEEAMAIATETRNDLLIAMLQMDLANALGWAGQMAEARPALEKAVTLVERIEDPLAVAYTYTAATTVAMQFADMRRSALGDYPDRLARWCEKHPEISSVLRLGWWEWAMIQRGELGEIEAKLVDWSREDHLEGFNKLGNLIPLGVSLWMQGRLDEALRVVDECELVGVNPRWYHDFYPLKVDVLVDLERLDAAVAAAEEYLGYETDATESAKKLGVMNPLVRGLADLGEDSPTPNLVAKGRSLIKRMQGILAEHPPPMDGSVSMETHTTHLLFAQAELTRFTDPDPSAWRAAMEAADFIYFRLHAQARLGEALIKSGSRTKAAAALGAAHAEADRIGARRLADLAQEIISNQP